MVECRGFRSLFGTSGSGAFKGVLQGSRRGFGGSGVLGFSGVLQAEGAFRAVGGVGLGSGFHSFGEKILRLYFLFDSLWVFGGVFE